MAVTNGPISAEARFENWPDAQARTWPESNKEPREEEYVGVAEYLVGIQKRNISALNLLGQLLKSVIGAGPESYELETSDSMTEHVKHIFDEACDIEAHISRLAYALLGINK